MIGIRWQTKKKLKLIPVIKIGCICTYENFTEHQNIMQILRQKKKKNMRTVITKMQLNKFEYLRIKLSITFKTQNELFGQTLILKLKFYLFSCLPFQGCSQ